MLSSAAKKPLLTSEVANGAQPRRSFNLQQVSGLGAGNSGSSPSAPAFEGNIFEEDRGSSGFGLLTRVQQRLNLMPADESCHEVSRQIQTYRSNREDACAINYLSTFASLPTKTSVPSVDQTHGDLMKSFNKLFTGQEKAKTILCRETLAAQATGNWRFKLCLTGGPGIGKSSLVQALGKITGRPVIVIRCDTLMQASQINGQLPSYQSPELGRILEGFIAAGRTNPIFFFDEIDKLPMTDSGQNIFSTLNGLLDDTETRFRSTYLSVNLDLSKCSFITAINSPAFLAGREALKSRLGLFIGMLGYDLSERKALVKEKFLPPLLSSLNLSRPNRAKLSMTDAAVDTLCSEHEKLFGGPGKLCGVRELKEIWLSSVVKAAFSDGVESISSDYVLKELNFLDLISQNSRQMEE